MRWERPGDRGCRGLELSPRPPKPREDAKQAPQKKKAARDEAAKAKAKKGQTKSVIQILPVGRHVAKRHLGTRKPGTGYDYLGEFDKFIPTNVEGIQLSSLFPQLAKQADKFSLIRGRRTHGNNGHETAAYLMQTGYARRAAR